MSDVLVDAVGLACPQPVIALAKAIRDVPLGTTVVVVADDPVAAVDIPAWCWTKGQSYDGLDVVADGEPPRYRVTRLV